MSVSLIICGHQKDYVTSFVLSFQLKCFFSPIFAHDVVFLFLNDFFFYAINAVAKAFSGPGTYFIINTMILGGNDHPL